MKRLNVSTIVVALVALLLVSPVAADEQDKRDRHLGRDAVGLVTLFATDCWTYVSQPVSLDAGGWGKIGVVALGAVYFLAFDEDIDRSMQQNKDGPLIRPIVDVGETFEVLGLMGKTNRYYAAGLVLGYAFRWEWIQRVSTDILFSHFIGGMMRAAARPLIGRARPKEDKGAYEWHTDSLSMPSGHASTIIQLAAVLSHHIDYWPATVMAYGIAGTVLVQRIEAREHWASDVWVGAWNGWAVAQSVMRNHDKRGYVVLPTVDPQTGAVGLYAEFSF